MAFELIRGTSGSHRVTRADFGSPVRIYIGKPVARRKGAMARVEQGAAHVGDGWQVRNGRHVMRLRFLGKKSSPGNSPTLWDTDEGQYVIQGFNLDPETRAQVGDVPPGELVIRVPKELMRYLPEACHNADDNLECAGSAGLPSRTG